MARRRWLRLGAVVAIAVGILAPATPVLAAPALSVTPSSGVVGATLNANATGFPPSQPVTFWWDDTTLLGTKTADSAGGATLSFKIPARATLGQHGVRACGGSFCPNGTPQPYADDTVTVILAATPAPTRPRPTATPKATPKPTSKPTARPTPTRTQSPPPATVAPTEPPSTDAPGTAAPSPSQPGSQPPGSQPPDSPPPGSPPGSEPPLVGPPSTPIVEPPLPPHLVAPHTLPPPPDQLGVPTPEEFPDLFVTDVEVTQGIQNLENAMPLVAGRRTYARVYVRVSGADTWGGTYGALHASRGGVSLGWIWPEDGAIVARAAGPNRLDLDDTLDFRLPESWTDGTVKLTAFAYSYDPDTPFENEPSDFNNLRDVTVTFHEAEPLTIHYATLHLHTMYDGAFPVVEFGPDMLSILGPLVRTSGGYLRFHPIAQANISVLPDEVLPFGHYQGHEFDVGWCTTTITESDTPGHFYLEDWTVLVEDPDPEEEGSIPLQSETLWIEGIEHFINSAYIAEDGQAQVFAGSTTLVTEPWPVGTEVMVDGCKLSGGYHEPNQVLGAYRAYYDWAAEREAFVGMIDPSLPGRFGGLSTGGTDSVWVRMRDSFFEVSAWHHRAAAIAAHETAHAAGLKHTPCLDADEDGEPDELKGGAIDPSHPEAEDFPECSLADEDPEGFMGFDVYWDLFSLDGPTVLSNDPTAAAPNMAFPFMSYASPVWADPYHYCRLMPYYGVPCDPDEVGIRWNHPVTTCPDCEPFTIPEPPSADAVQPLVLVWGEVDPETGSVEIVETRPLPDPTRRMREWFVSQRIPDDRASAWLVVVDEEGRELRRVPVDAAEFGHEADEDDAHPFTAIIEVPDGARRLELVDRSGETSGSVPVSEGLPEIAGLFLETEMGELGKPAAAELGWRATDPDGDPLTFDVLYSPDGDQWQLLAPDLREPAYRVDSLAGLPGSGAGRFRVVASDGVHAAYADTALLEVPGSAPRPVVVFPPSGATFPLQGTIILEGSAFDLEDRGLEGEALAWTSSIDGPLGSGGEVRRDDLSAGRHTITLEAGDSDGMTATASIEIVVDGSVVQPVPGADTEAAIERLFAAVNEGRDPATSVDEHPDFLWLPVTAGIGIAVLGLAAAWYLRSGRAPTAGRRPGPLAHEAAHVQQGGGAAPATGGTAIGQAIGDVAVGGNERPASGAAGLPPELPVMGSLTEGGWSDAAPQPPPPPPKQPEPELQGLVPGSEDPEPASAPPAQGGDGGSTWIETGQLATTGSMDPAPGGGSNDVAMDDVSGTENAEGTATKDVQLKGRNISEN